MSLPVHLVVDSTADITTAYRDTHGLTVVPLRVIFGDDELRDFYDISPTEFYARMTDAKSAPPRTSQPTPMEFEEAFRVATADGGSVVCTTISADMSGTWNSATTARASLPDADIHVFDTRTCGPGHHLMTRTAVTMKEAGVAAKDIVTALERVLATQRVVFTVETLEHLRRGGRIGGASALLGSMLSIKPVLEVRDGKVATLDKVRTYSRAIDRLVEELRVAAQSWGGKAVVVVAHGARPERAQEMVARVGEWAVGDVDIIDVGPVIGCHTGPGAIGLAFHKPLAGSGE